MDLSIIIVNYNTKDLLKRCLESVVSDWLIVVGNQSPATSNQPPITEVIVVDNGSTDGSAEMLQGLMASREKKQTPRATSHQPPVTLRLIKNKENLGFAKAVNQGIKQARGEAIFLLNPDTIVKPESLKKLLEFEKKVSPAIVGVRMLNSDGSIQGSVFNLPTVKRAIEEFWLGKKGAFSKYAPFEDKPIEVESVSGGAMLISKKVIEKIGLFDERYFMYFEDLDYCRRARKAGFKIWYLPTVEIIHEHGASGRNLADEKDQWKRLIPSSKIYHGFWGHYLINLIIRVGQKCRRNF